MDRDTFLGGSPLGVLIRLVLLSIVVGVVLDVLGITPFNILERLQILLRNIYDLGFDTFKSILRYLALGAIVVVPIWLIGRIIKTAKRGSSEIERK
jgi:uncharacterized oligopeptide transporter (OPT) family protein